MENQSALNREVADERTPEGHLDVLKACASAGILCGFELNSTMVRLLDAPSQKHRTLYSLLRDVLGKEAQVSWIAPQYIAGRQPRILLIKPKHARAILDRTVVWDVAISDEAGAGAYKLGQMTGLDADPVDAGGGLTGSYRYSQRIRMPIRTVLNHLAATNNASWQVVYSSRNKEGKLSMYSGKK